MGEAYVAFQVIAALYAIGSAIYTWFFQKGSDTLGPRMKDKDSQVSTYGIPIPVIYGTVRTAGNVIWAGPWIEVAITETVGKGGGGSSYTRYEYKRSFAVAFCEGEVDQLLKLWCDSKLVYNITGDNEKLAKQPGMAGGFKFYTGSETQMPDPIMEAQEGAGKVPAYRGVAYVVFNRLNLSRYGNRIPNVRALIGEASLATSNTIKEVPGYLGDGFNRDRYYSLQVLMAADESYIIVHEPNWSGDLTGGCVFYKISTYTRQAISYRYFDWPDVCTTDDICSGMDEASGFGYGGCERDYVDPFGWHHPACVDELGRVYSCSCDGYGKFYRLNSDTWQWEARSPIVPNSTYETDAGPYGWTDPPYDRFAFMQTRVSKNPGYPYLWAKTYSEEQGWGGPPVVVLIHRETMTNPFNLSHWGYIFWPPDPAGTTPDYQDLPYAFCLNDEDGSCYVLWMRNYGGDNFFLSKLFPDGTRIDTEITEYLSPHIQYTYSLGDHMAYDPYTDQIIIHGQYNQQFAPGGWHFFDGTDLSYILSKAWEITDQDWFPANHNEDNFHRGVVNGCLYVSNFYADENFLYVRIMELDCSSRITRIVWEGPYDEAGPNLDDYLWQFNGGVYCDYKQSMFCETEYNDGIYDDTILREVLIGRYNPATGVLLRDIVSDICVRCSIATADINATTLTQSVYGYLVSDQITGVESIRPLSSAYMFDGVEVDSDLEFVRRGGPSVATIDETELSAHSDGEERPTPLKQVIKQEADLPVEVTLQYYDKDMNQDVNVQLAKRIITNTVNKQSVQLPVAMEKDRAKQLAEIMLGWAWTSRTSFEFNLGAKYLHLVPTDVITIEKTEATYQMMLTGISLEGNILKCQAVQDYESLYVSTASGTPGLIPDEEIDYAGSPIWYLLDVPPLQDSQGSDGGLYSVANGYTDYFTGADIYIYDAYTGNWSVFSSPSNRAVTGVATTALARFDNNIFDESHTVTVRLDYEDHYLESCTETEIMQGHNYALLGDEIIQFQTITDNGSSSYTLSKLLRGRKGTEWATKNHIAGEKFILLSTTTVFWTSLNSTYLQVETQFRGVSHDSDFSEGVNKLYTPNFATLKPWSPVHISCATTGAGATVSWIRRNRIQNEWLNYQDVPMSETSESYSVDFYTGTTVSFTKSASTTSCTASAASISSIDSLLVYQISSAVGRGFASATLSI